MTPSLVSAVLPVFNGERFVAAAIDSILAQNYAPIEIIIVDDGSTDGSVDVVARFPEARLIKQKNSGAAAARNTGVRESRGDFIAFLDHDDCWEPEKTRLQVEHLEKHPDVGFVLGAQKIFLEPGTDPPSWLTDARMNEKSVCAGTGTMMARRELFSKVGPFDSAYINGEDTDWFVRAIEAGFNFDFVEDAVILRRFHGENATYNTAEMRRSLLKIMHASVRRKRDDH